MIKINLYLNSEKALFLIEISGHSFKEKNNLSASCAAVSAVVLGGINTIQKNKWIDIRFELKDGYAKIEQIKKNSKKDIFWETLMIQLFTIEKYFSKEIEINQIL